jgi:LmbE family N-acetylglucosaminyl deacetylase
MGVRRAQRCGRVIGLSSRPITTIAVIGAHCDDIAIGAGATLMEITRRRPNVIVHALVLTGGGTVREVEEKNAFAEFCGDAQVRLTVADLPDGRLPAHWDEVKERLAAFRRSCDPDLVIGPQPGDAHQDHRVVAELTPTEFRGHLVLGYEILKWESDLPKTTMYQPISAATARRKTELLSACYSSQAGRDWFDDETFLALMRVRGVQCRSRFAEAFLVSKGVIDFGGTEMST